MWKQAKNRQKIQKHPENPPPQHQIQNLTIIHLKEKIKVRKITPPPHNHTHQNPLLTIRIKTTTCVHIELFVNCKLCKQVKRTRQRPKGISKYWTQVLPTNNKALLSSLKESMYLILDTNNKALLSSDKVHKIGYASFPLKLNGELNWIVIR